LFSFSNLLIVHLFSNLYTRSIAPQFKSENINKLNADLSLIIEYGPTGKRGETLYISIFGYDLYNRDNGKVILHADAVDVKLSY